MKKLVETKLSIITVSLVLLTFTVIIYDIHAFNPPRVLYMVVLMARGGEAPEWTTEDITNHPLKEQIMRYVNMSYLTGRRQFEEYSLSGHVYIVNDPEMEEFFGKYYVSSWCGTCNSAYLKDGDDYYYFMVGYSVAPYLDRRLAWSFSISIVILWILRAFSVLESKKGGEKMKRKFKVVFTILLVLTAIIAVLAYKHNIDYQRHVQELRKEYEDLGINPDIVTPSPWHVWGMGGLVAFLVVVTIEAWIVSSIIWFQERHKKARITSSEACHRLALNEGQKENQEMKKGVRK